MVSNELYCYTFSSKLNWNNYIYNTQPNTVHWLLSAVHGIIIRITFVLRGKAVILNATWRLWSCIVMWYYVHVPPPSLFSSPLVDHPGCSSITGAEGAAPFWPSWLSWMTGNCGTKPFVAGCACDAIYSKVSVPTAASHTLLCSLHSYVGKYSHGHTCSCGVAARA